MAKVELTALEITYRVWQAFCCLEAIEINYEPTDAELDRAFNPRMNGLFNGGFN